MKYQEALGYLYSQLPMFHRIGADAYKPSLTNTLQLCRYLGNPHLKFKSVHIAGTNGKGSSSNMLASILQEAGYKTGLYTSPHLKDFRERIRINGQMIPEEKVIEFVHNNRTVFEEIQPSFFEMTVALAFNHFAHEQIDIAIVEVGMGGRLDSTNIITPLLSLITNIGFDHMQFLGDSLEKIAGEKAGIIKEKVPVIISESQPETQDIFIQKSAEKHSPVSFADRVWMSEKNYQSNEELNLTLTHLPSNNTFHLSLDLSGSYQEKNSKGILECVYQLRSLNYSISDDHIHNGLSKTKQNTGFSGRWHKLSDKPLIVCDTGHNEAGITEVLNQLSNTSYQKLHWVFGLVSDKDVSKILTLLPEDACYYFCKAQIPRAMDAHELQNKAGMFNLHGQAYESVKDALNAAKTKANDSDLILIGGSTFVVAEVI